MTQSLPLNGNPEREVIARVADAGSFRRWQRQVAATGFCRRPIRLQGHVDALDPKTGELRASYTTAAEPSGTLLIACGNRRAAICPPCSATYRADTWQLVAAGLCGGKGMPESVVEHPMLFVTLTAPSFGPVHTIRSPRAHRTPPCRRGKGMCPHGRPRGCSQVHASDAAALGTPLCHECFDYVGAVLWNSMVGELWRRTTIYLRRAIASQAGLTAADSAKRVKLAFTKVAEYQRRGQVHLHIVLRLDAAPPKARPEVCEPPPDRFDAALLAAAMREAVAAVEAPMPWIRAGRHLHVARWGQQLDIREIVSVDESANPRAIAAYVAKYATKSTELVGPGLQQPIRSAADLALLDTSDHARRLVSTAWRLGGLKALEPLRLRRWAHTCGFGGHFSTRSRRYSTTLGALRQARADWKLLHAHHPGPDPWVATKNESGLIRFGHWTYVGSGHHTLGDTWLAATAEAQAALASEARRCELATAPTATSRFEPTWRDR